MTNSLIEEYVNLTIFHASLDSFDPKNVATINETAKRIIEIADQVNSLGGVEEFAILLDHKEHGVRSWAAFNLMERMTPSTAIEKKALEHVEKLAQSNNINAIGAELWLKDWTKKG